MPSAIRVALVTGGASGMGRDVTEGLVKRGWKVTVADVNEKLGQETVTTLGVENVLFRKTDVTSFEDQAKTFQATLDKWGRLDYVIANAGLGDQQDFFTPAKENEHGLPIQPDTYVLDVCLTGVVWSAYLGYQYFRKSPADSLRLIGATSSLAGLYPAGAIPLYGMAKHGVVGLTRSLASKYDVTGVRVNCVCPGLVPTPLPPAEWFVNRDHIITPISTVTNAYLSFIDNKTSNGQVVECSQDKHFHHNPQPYTNNATKQVIEGSMDIQDYETRSGQVNSAQIKRE